MQTNQPQPDKFQYTLDVRGVETDVLFETPDGWLKTNISYKRSKIYSGVVRALTLPIKYVGTGATIVRREFYKYGLLARINQYIYSFNPTTWLYVQMFFGKLDFSKWSDEPTGVSVPLTENNINVQVAAFGDQQYSIPLNVPSEARAAWITKRGYDPMVDILLTPLQLEETADFIFETSPDFRMNAFFELSIADYQQMSVSASVKGVGFFQQGSPIFANQPQEAFFVAQTDTVIRFNTALDPVSGLLLPNSISTSCNDEAGGGNANYQFNIYDQTGTLRKTMGEFAPVGTQEYQFSFDFTVKVNKGDKLYFYILNTEDPSGGTSETSHGVNMQGGAFSMTFFTATPATHCQALRPNYIYDYLVQQMNGTENPAIVTQSLLLDGPLFQAAITCSDAILTSQVARIYQAGDNLQIGATYEVYGDRATGGVVHYFNPSGVATNFPIGSTFVAIFGQTTFTNDADTDCFVQQVSNNPQILISFNQFFKAIYGIQGAQAGVGLDPMASGKYCLEDLRYFYRGTPNSAISNQAALDLGANIDVKSPRFEVSDMCVNSIKGGYEDPQLTALNASQEVNSSVAYGTLITSPVRELDISSPINAACFAIEEKRIQPGYSQPSSGLSGTFYLNSAASRSDNSNHFVWITNVPDSVSGFYQPLTCAAGCKLFSGVDGSYYNWMLSPKRNLLRGTNYLASIFDKMQGYQILLTQAKKNSALVTVDMNGFRVSESDPVNISDLGSQIFLPYYDNLTTGLDFNAEQLLSVNPYGEIWYMYRGINWKGFIAEVSVDKGENTPQTFKVLLSPSNDLSKRVF